MDEPTSGTGLEAAIARLEAIVDRLDSEDLELQEALDLFEEGVSHVRNAYGVLERASLRVETLVADVDGTVSIEARQDG